jgi:hypothetical protein
VTEDEATEVVSSLYESWYSFLVRYASRLTGSVDSAEDVAQVGPDAQPFLAWRGSMNDDSWTLWSAQSDSDWLKSVKVDFGMDLKLD